MNPFLIVGVLFASIISFGLMSLGLMVIGRMVALSLQRARETTKVPPELRKAQAVAQFVPVDDEEDGWHEANAISDAQALAAARREQEKLKSLKGK